MRAFLSHSSKDKPFVENVSDLLRPGTFELDALTFDAGLLNAQAILEALQRSDLFCLFLSEDSADSTYVDFEGQIAVELLASGKLDRFLTICLDDSSFERASSNVKLFNVVRKTLTPESAARLIQGVLVTASKADSSLSHPFIGRDGELLELEGQLADHNRPPAKAVYLSGNFGSGRRTLAKKLYQNQFPRVGSVFPTINIEAFAGLEELYRAFLAALRPTITAQQLLARIRGFEVASLEEKRRLTAELLNSLLAGHEAAFLLDQGGVLTDSGAFEPEINEVISRLEARPHPPAVFIAPRMVPLRLRRSENDLAYAAVRSLVREASRRLISKLLKDKQIASDDAAIDDLVFLGDGHPFNMYRMIDEIGEKGLKSFLANPSEFINWKHRQSSEYLNKMTLNEREVGILALLRLVPELDFDTFVSALRADAAQMSDDLLRLSNLHILESNADRFMVAPPLRVAVERDRRVRLSDSDQQDALRTISRSLTVRFDEGTAPVTLVNTAVLASLEAGEAMSGLAAAFLLPSHYIWLSKVHYDKRNWAESIRLALEALKSRPRLSHSGFVAGCRFLCLSAARLGEEDVFQQGIRQLEADAADDWARSNVAFLKGFNLRLKGSLPSAETEFRESYRLSPGNISAAREIASISLVRGNLGEAERFAREAYGQAGNNPYVIDILISVLIRKHGRNSKDIAEIRDMFDILEKVGEEGGKSFYTTRMAEFEFICGTTHKARKFVEKAIGRTPRIFEPHKIYAEILLKEGNKTKARDELNFMREMVNSRDANERRSNFRAYLQIYAKYLTEIGQFDEAKKVFEDGTVFTDEERVNEVRQIEIIQSYIKKK